MVSFKIHPNSIEIIWLDGHPVSKLDGVWETLFGDPVRAGSIKAPVSYDTMIWNGFGPRSHINKHTADFLPYIEAYRNFVFNISNVKDNHNIMCKELRITLIWRRDYVAHPRNPTGHMSRKILNDKTRLESDKGG